MDKNQELEVLKKQTKDADLPLKQDAQTLVFGKGNPDAPILFIGEAPGAKEDEQGIPFVGRAGKNLDKSLRSIGLSLDDCYIANILKYRPPKNRDPNKEEIASHTPFLVEQINIIQPVIIATLGNFSSKLVLAGFSVEGMKQIPGVSDIHGQIHKIEADGQEYTVIPFYHPAASMYRPSLKDTLAEDFIKMGEFLIEHLEDTDHIKDALAQVETQTRL